MLNFYKHPVVEMIGKRRLMFVICISGSCMLFMALFYTKRYLQASSSTTPEISRDQIMYDSLDNLSRECWEACGEKAGHCLQFCGREAACCRLGFDDPIECGYGWRGCDEQHCCAAKRGFDKWASSLRYFEWGSDGLEKYGNTPDIKIENEFSEWVVAEENTHKSELVEWALRDQKEVERNDSRNLGQQCWTKCAGRGGYCPQFCGSSAACCRLGWADDPPECAGGCQWKHCCTEILL